jgi:hypothetical protein
VRSSFLLGGVLSAVVVVFVALRWGVFATAYSEAAIALSVAALLVDVVASRPARALSERDSPLNLPVFG